MSYPASATVSTSAASTGGGAVEFRPDGVFDAKLYAAHVKPDVKWGATSKYFGMYMDEYMDVALQLYAVDWNATVLVVDAEGYCVCFGGLGVC